MRHHIGSATVEAKESSRDQEEFLGYLQGHGMALLNTWNAKPAYTCQTGDAQTQIDFIICRVQHADKIAKDSRPWHQSPVGRWKANHHIPVWASVRLINPGKLPQKKPFKSFECTLQDSIENQDQKARQLQDKAKIMVQEIPYTGNLEDMSAKLDNILLKAVEDIYTPDKTKDNRVSQVPAVQHSVKAMWQIDVRSIHGDQKQYAMSQKTSRIYKAKTKEAKKERILQISQDLAKAEARGDQRKLWELPS